MLRNKRKSSDHSSSGIWLRSPKLWQYSGVANIAVQLSISVKQKVISSYSILLFFTPVRDTSCCYKWPLDCWCAPSDQYASVSCCSYEKYWQLNYEVHLYRNKVYMKWSIFGIFCVGANLIYNVAKLKRIFVLPFFLISVRHMGSDLNWRKIHWCILTGYFEGPYEFAMSFLVLLCWLSLSVETEKSDFCGQGATVCTGMLFIMYTM